jgi:hypothetical protein
MWGRPPRPPFFPSKAQKNLVLLIKMEWFGTFSLSVWVPGGPFQATPLAQFGRTW